MSHARDLLNSVLSGPTGLQGKEELPSPLSATLVTKPPPITSVEAFNAQLTIGSKDESLRKAANLFKSAAESMERSRLKGEKYWVDALRIRRANWGLTPAPLPLGAATGKGADKTSKDFVISYGLEGCKLRFLPSLYFIKSEYSTYVIQAPCCFPFVYFGRFFRGHPLSFSSAHPFEDFGLHRRGSSFVNIYF